MSGLKELFQALEHLAQKHGKLRAAVINQRLGHSPNHALRHDVRIRDLKKRAPGQKSRERYLIVVTDVKRFSPVI